ncbi:MAG: transcriptional regulator NrdR [Lachnospiraceae bacterium]|nr:transcriptional regulator NrdR [Lachnospiraceae bacterium]
MKCPYCGHDNTRVVDSRPADDNTAIRRRRMCDSCGKRFTSYEKVERLPLMVIKKDQNREVFNRGKLEGGIIRACHKRPVSAQDIKNLVDSIEIEVYSQGDQEVSSSYIGEIVMDKLKELDAVAYVRFASVYREFKDVDSFMEALKKMIK